MKKLIIVGAAAFIGIALVYGIATYNSLVRQEQGIAGSWAQVQNVFQRRADLVPNLVATVSGAATFEKSTMIAVTEARASVGRVQLSANEFPDEIVTD